MIRAHPRWAWLAAVLFVVAALFCVPVAMEANALLQAEDDPVALADRGIARAFDRSTAITEIEAALAASDADLAQSFVDLAGDRSIELPAELRQRVTAAVEQANSAGAAAQSFASGLVTGEPKDMAGFAGTALGDLFVFGDIRDAVREGSRFIAGQEYDQLILGLSCVGIAITAGTYATVGAGAPVRLGLTAVKAARKAGRLSSQLAGYVSRSLREAVDVTALRRVSGVVSEPAVVSRAAREAVKVDKAGGLMKMVGDVGTVQTKAGTKAALDGLRIAQTPKEVARVAELAAKKGSRTRAVLKLLGRSAIVLSIASFNLVSWMLWAILTVIGFVTSAKAAVERATQRGIDRRRAERLAATQAPVFA